MLFFLQKTSYILGSEVVHVLDLGVGMLKKELSEEALHFVQRNAPGCKKFA